MRTIAKWLMAVGLVCGAMAAWAEEEHVYSEGVVVNVAYVRTKYGMFNEYMKYLDGPYKALLEEQKKAGVIVDYGVYVTDAHNPHEPDVILTTVYKNWAALDGLRDKTEPVLKKVFGSLDAASKGAVDRDKVREIIGSQNMQRLLLK